MELWALPWSMVALPQISNHQGAAPWGPWGVGLWGPLGDRLLGSTGNGPLLLGAKSLWLLGEGPCGC
jgi:hypothetical protein